jgi:hypothetical protein
MPLRNLYRRLLLASLSEGSCRIAVNRRRRASFDGNASLLALLCTPSCRNTADGSSRTVRLSSYTEAAVAEAVHLEEAVAEAVHLEEAVAEAVANTGRQCPRGG